MKYIFIILLLFSDISFASEIDCNKDIGAFLECNNPIVIKYLSSLSSKDVGNKIAGVQLTDKNVLMKNYKFLGKSSTVPKTTHLYLFEHENQIEAFAWVETGGEELKIPDCPKNVSFEHAYVITGDVYTWNSVQPGDGVVQIMCIDKRWQTK